jgi:hypothetical protein
LDVPIGPTARAKGAAVNRQDFEDLHDHRRLRLLFWNRHGLTARRFRAKWFTDGFRCVIMSACAIGEDQ